MGGRRLVGHRLSLLYLCRPIQGVDNSVPLCCLSCPVQEVDSSVPFCCLRHPFKEVDRGTVCNATLRGTLEGHGRRIGCPVQEVDSSRRWTCGTAGRRREDNGHSLCWLVSPVQEQGIEAWHIQLMGHSSCRRRRRPPVQEMEPRHCASCHLEGPVRIYK